MMNVISQELKPSLVGMASLVSEILLAFTTAFGPWGQKIESTQNIHANRGWCEIHVHQVWWA